MRGRRIFLGIDISNDAREACTGHAEVLRRDFPHLRVGWERPEKMHVTLKFIGNTTNEKLERLQEAIAGIAERHQTIQTTLTAPGVFPNRSKPRILWIGLADPENSIAAIHLSIDAVCAQLGYEKERKPFAPHVTIGRIRDPQNGPAIARAHLTMRVEPIEFDVTQIVIYESKLQASGSVYTPVVRLSLA